MRRARATSKSKKYHFELSARTAARIETSRPRMASLSVHALSCTSSLSMLGIVAACRAPFRARCVYSNRQYGEFGVRSANSRHRCSSSELATRSQPNAHSLDLLSNYRSAVQYFFSLLLSSSSLFLAYSPRLYRSDLIPKKKLKILDIPAMVQIGRSN